MLIDLVVLAAVARAYVTLELAHTADGSVVASTALLATLRVGEPEQRYSLMLDFNHSEIEIDACVETQSRFYDVAGSHSDKITFEEDSAHDLRARGVFRASLRQHCSAINASVPPLRSEHRRFADNCVVAERCQGVLGLGRRSPLWEVWTGYTLSVAALHLGRDHPLFRSVDADADADAAKLALRCSHSPSERICEFEATLGGIDVVVDFHTDDSYVWLPHHIYALYMAERSLDDLPGARRLFRDRDLRHHNLINDAAESDRSHEHRRAVSADDDDDDDHHPLPRREVRLFHRALADARERAPEHSRYYQRSLRSDWFPLVFEPRADAGHGSDAVIVLDHELLVHVPGSAGSYGGVERSALETFVGRGAAVAHETRLLLRPHTWAPIGDDARPRVSIGNGVLRRFVLHRDLLRGHLLLEPHVVNEHLSALETAFATLLFTLFVRSLAHSIELLTPLALCMQRACPGCAHTERTERHHRRIETHSVWEAVLYFLSLGVAVAMAIRLTELLDDASSLLAYAWTALALNGVAWSAALFYSALADRDRRPAAGAYCWRAFRVGAIRYAGAEQTQLLGAFFVLLLLRREVLSSIGAVIMALLLAGNGARHLYHALRANYALAQQRHIGGGSGGPDLPSKSSDLLWVGFICVVLLGCDVVATVWVGWRLVLWPLLQSNSVIALFYAATLLIALKMVDRYSAAELEERRKKTS